MKPTIEVTDEFISINVSRHYTYDIEIDQIRSDHKTGRMDWWDHLKRKPWWNEDLESEMAEIFFDLDLDVNQ